jgi:hypothetical protein
MVLNDTVEREDGAMQDTRKGIKKEGEAWEW